MFFASGCIPVLFYMLKASSAAAPFPPITLSDISLAAPLQLSDSAQSSTNETQEQESLLPLYSNHTLTTNVSNFEITYPVTSTFYYLRVSNFDQHIFLETLLEVYQRFDFFLRVKVNAGQGAGIPRRFERMEQYPHPPRRRVILMWQNQCRKGQFGSYEDWIPILEALRNVTTGVGVVPPQYRISRCTFEVLWDAGGGMERVIVGAGLVGGDPFGNGVS